MGVSMAFRKIDLTTENGAASAASAGSLACFAMAGLSVVAVAALVSTEVFPAAALIGILGYTVIAVTIHIVAGWRLRRGKGVVWGSVAAFLVVLEIAAKVATPASYLSLFINAILLLVIVNGVRGARALRRGFIGVTAQVFE